MSQILKLHIPGRRAGREHEKAVELSSGKEEGGSGILPSYQAKLFRLPTTISLDTTTKFL